MELTLLTSGQVFGDENTKKLEILKKYGTMCAVTDFAILTGASVSMCFVTVGNNHYARTGEIWTKSYEERSAIITAHRYGTNQYRAMQVRDCSIRPILIMPNSSLVGMKKINNNGIPMIEYGFYPQASVLDEISELLNNEYTNNNLVGTSNNYIIDSAGYDDLHTPFTPRLIKEYIYDNKRYIRFSVDNNCQRETLSDGKKLKFGDVVWVEVLPIRWLFDEETNLLVSEKGLVSGIQFDNKYSEQFEETNMYKFLNNYLRKDIFPKELKITVEKEESVLDKVEKDRQKVLELLKRK